MAEEAGRERAVFGGNIAQKKPFTQDDIRRLSENRGHIDLVWANLQAFRLRPNLPITVAGAISRMQEAYMETFSRPEKPCLPLRVLENTRSRDENGSINQGPLLLQS